MDTINACVIFNGITEDSPPRLLFSKHLNRADGKSRVYTEAVPVLDEMLQRRIAAELQINDEIELTVAYDYSAPGWPSRVCDFRKFASSNLIAAHSQQDLAAA